MIRKFKSLSLEKRISIVGLVLIGIYVLFLITSGLVHRHQLTNKGVYYIAEIIKIKSSKSGPHYYIEYTFKGKRYEGDFKPNFDFRPSKEKAFIFIKILPDNPKIHQFQDLGEVSDCQRQLLPPEGWHNIPTCK